MKIGVVLKNGLLREKQKLLIRLFEKMQPENGQTAVWTAVTYISTLWYEALQEHDKPHLLLYYKLYIDAVADGFHETKELDPMVTDDHYRKIVFQQTKRMYNALLGSNGSRGLDFTDMKKVMLEEVAKIWVRTQNDVLQNEVFAFFVETPVHWDSEKKLRLDMLRSVADKSFPTRRLIQALRSDVLVNTQKRANEAHNKEHVEYIQELTRGLITTRARNVGVEFERSALGVVELLEGLPTEVIEGEVKLFVQSLVDKIAIKE